MSEQSNSQILRSIEERSETPKDAELDYLAEQARRGSSDLGWGGSFGEGRKTPGDTNICSERDVIATIGERIEHLIALVADDTRISANGRRESKGGSDLTEIIEFLDIHLQRTGKQNLTPPEANRLLERAGLLHDNPGKPGAPLRKLLRQGAIPHAHQPSGKGTRWLIPHSSSKER